VRSPDDASRAGRSRLLQIQSDDVPRSDVREALTGSLRHEVIDKRAVIDLQQIGAWQGGG